MGYTHYWTPSKNKIPEKTLKLISDILQQGFSKNIIAYDGFSENNCITLPIATENEIQFNGIGDDSHETFQYLTNGRWNFCKTARKPYDFYVCVVLLILKNSLPDFEFSSDGNDEDWNDARIFVNELEGS